MEVQQISGNTIANYYAINEAAIANMDFTGDLFR